MILMGFLILAECPPFAWLVNPAFACLVPVFRYALERWEPDYYQAVLIHRGQMTENDSRLLEELRQAGRTAEAAMNLNVQEIDVASYPADKIKGLLGAEIPEKLPALALWYPMRGGWMPPIWLGELTPSTVAALTASPVRQQLAGRLIGGQSAVWIFVESGDAGKNKAAMQLLGGELEAATKELKEMAPSQIEGWEGPELSYEFSILALSHTDPQEQMLLAMLLNSEPDLHEYKNEPMAFPVFGRGRVLCALVGAGIRVDNIREIIAFLTGPCGCEIKMMYPGVDLLMAANWDAAVMGYYEVDYPLPALTGVMPEAPVIKGTEEQSRTGTEGQNLQPETQNQQPASREDPSGSWEDPSRSQVAQEQKLRGLGVIATTTVMFVVIGLVVALGTLAVSWRRRTQL